MKIKIELGEGDIKRLVRQELSRRLGSDPSEKDIKIETKSKQNYRSEWERADYRVIYEADL